MSKKKYKKALAKNAEFKRLLKQREDELATDGSSPIHNFGKGFYDPFSALYKDLRSSTIKYLDRYLEDDQESARLALSQYLGVVKEVLITPNLLRDRELARAVTPIIDSLQLAIECVGTEQEHPLLSSSRKGRPKIGPSRRQYLAQVAAAITHCMAYADMDKDLTCQRIANQLSEQQAQILRPRKEFSAATKSELWKYLRNERDRILRGSHGALALKQHDMFLLLYDKKPTSYKASLEQYPGILPLDFDLDSTLELLRDMGRPRPVK